ncbi:MAG: hypothetical protein LBR22_06845 [Desulfovibrio sp.]|nr:hypothetical protein [Desulfovibrio sp.]
MQKLSIPDMEREAILARRRRFYEDLPEVPEVDYFRKPKGDRNKAGEGQDASAGQFGDGTQPQQAGKAEDRDGKDPASPDNARNPGNTRNPGNAGNGGDTRNPGDAEIGRPAPSTGGGKESADSGPVPGSHLQPPPSVPGSGPTGSGRPSHIPGPVHGDARRPSPESRPPQVPTGQSPTHGVMTPGPGSPRNNAAPMATPSDPARSKDAAGPTSKTSNAATPPPSARIPGGSVPPTGDPAETPTEPGHARTSATDGQPRQSAGQSHHAPATGIAAFFGEGLRLGALATGCVFGALGEGIRKVCNVGAKTLEERLEACRDAYLDTRMQDLRGIAARCRHWAAQLDGDPLVRDALASGSRNPASTKAQRMEDFMAHLDTPRGADARQAGERLRESLGNLRACACDVFATAARPGARDANAPKTAAGILRSCSRELERTPGLSLMHDERGRTLQEAGAQLLKDVSSLLVRMGQDIAARLRNAVPQQPSAQPGPSPLM